jgi:hypothetical protein
MGLGKLVRKAVRKVSRAVGIGGGGGSPSQPTPAPELELQDTQGEAEEKKDTEKVQRRKGKKALKISTKDTPVVTGAGRNIV